MVRGWSYIQVLVVGGDVGVELRRLDRLYPNSRQIFPIRVQDHLSPAAFSSTTLRKCHRTRVGLPLDLGHTSPPPNSHLNDLSHPSAHFVVPSHDSGSVLSSRSCASPGVGPHRRHLRHRPFPPRQNGSS